MTPVTDWRAAMSHQHEGHDVPPSFWSSRYAIGMVVIGGVAAYFVHPEIFITI